MLRAVIDAAKSNYLGTPSESLGLTPGFTVTQRKS